MAAIHSTGSRFWWDERLNAYGQDKTGRASFAVRLAFASVLILAAPLDARAQTFTPKDEAPEQFPDFPNREETFYSCSACHAFKLVASQGMSRARWDGVIDLMSDRHGMAKLDAKEREPLLDYLEKAFPERTEPGGWQNPFLKK
jgi:hypothetical protein